MKKNIYRCTAAIFCITLLGILFSCKEDQDDTSSPVTPITSAWPISRTSTPDLLADHYGPRILSGNYDFHRGLDIANFQDGSPVIDGVTPIYSILPGTVVRIENEIPPADCATSTYAFKRFGNFVVVHHGDVNGDDLQSTYLHLNSYKVQVGDKVAAGDIIGFVGNTGCDINSVHLHFETYAGITPSGSGKILRLYTKNPYTYLPYSPVKPDVSLNRSSQFLTFTIIQEKGSVDIVRYEVQTDVSAQINLDFESREGIDPNSDDTSSYNGITLIPSDYTASDSHYQLTLKFDATILNQTAGDPDSDGTWNALNAVTLTMVNARGTRYQKSFSFMISSTTPAEGATNIGLNTPIAVTFDKTMDTSSITTNVSDTSCSGTFLVSVNDFLSCIQMVGTPVSSDGGQTFTVTPSSDLPFNTTVKLKITTGAKDVSGQNLSSDYISSLGFETRSMILINGGTFTMGDPSDDSSQSHVTREMPAHDVTIDSFYINTHEVTAAEYKVCVDAGSCTTPPVDANGTYNVTGKNNHPINLVSWEDAKQFITWMNSGSNINYRLCSEAEWEYAARAGSTTFYPCGDNPSCMGDYAWYSDNSGSSSQEVKTRQPNAFGLYDMMGNVHEHVEDYYHTDYTGAPTDGSAWLVPADTSNYRVFRGGHWTSSETYLRSSYRYRRSQSSTNINTGFRFCADYSP